MDFSSQFNILNSNEYLITECANAEFAAETRQALTLAGFVDIQHEEIGSKIVLKGRKPSYAIGSRMSLKMRPNSGSAISQSQQSLSQSATEAQISSAGIRDHGALGDDDIIDDEDLLNADDRIKPDIAALKSPETCETKPKACKNCSCGRAEVEAQEEIARTQPDSLKKGTISVVPISSCGNCALGDAFRCSACPYSGLPAFKPGERVLIPVDMMGDDL